MTYVLSDIHGNLGYFQAILEKIHLGAEDFLYVLGDVIDRHPYGIRILQQIIRMPNACMLLGNHEYMMMEALQFPYDDCGRRLDRDPGNALNLWYWNGGLETHAAWDALSWEEQVEIHQYLRALPLNLSVHVGDTTYQLVHAAPVELYSTPESVGIETVAYHAVWDRDVLGEMEALQRNIVFGHTPTVSFQQCFPQKIWRSGHLIGIDCGSGWPLRKGNGQPYGGRLACVRLEDMEEFYAGVDDISSSAELTW